MIKIHELNQSDRIIIYNYKGMNIADGGHCATVIDLSKKNFEYDTAIVRTDGQEKVLELTDEDYFDKLPISHKKMESKSIHSPRIKGLKITPPLKSDRTPAHYAGTDNVDVIEFTRQQFGNEEWIAAMKFNIIEYTTRLGRKDDIDKELDKIIDYAQRLKEGLAHE